MLKLFKRISLASGTFLIRIQYAFHFVMVVLPVEDISTCQANSDSSSAFKNDICHLVQDLQPISKTCNLHANSNTAKVSQALDNPDRDDPSWSPEESH